MVKVYAIALAVGIVGLIWIIFGGALADNLDRPELDPGSRIGARGRMVVGAICGFGMGGMAAEFSPLAFSTAAASLLAVAGAVVGVAWIRYFERHLTP